MNSSIFAFESACGDDIKLKLPNVKELIKAVKIEGTLPRRFVNLDIIPPTIVKILSEEGLVFWTSAGERMLILKHELANIHFVSMGVNDEKPAEHYDWLTKLNTFNRVSDLL